MSWRKAGCSGARRSIAAGAVSFTVCSEEAKERSRIEIFSRCYSWHGEN